MNPVDIAIIVVVLAVVAVGAWRAIGTATGKRDCCSGDAKDGGTSARREFPAPNITDTDESHYPYEADLTIGGMSCEHCVQAVTRALDSVEGTWAIVELAGGQAHVRSKEPINEDAYREVVEAAGYRLVSLD